MKTGTQTALVVLALAFSDWTAVLTVVIWIAVLGTVVTGVDYCLKAAALVRVRGDATGVVPAGGPPGSLTVGPIVTGFRRGRLSPCSRTRLDSGRGHL